MSRVAKRYAKALFELAQENNSLQAVDDDFKQIDSLIIENSDFYDFIQNPLINTAERKGIVDQVFKNKISTMSYNFLMLVNGKNRLVILPEIIACFQDFVKEYSGVVEGELFSAVKLDDTQVKQIKENVEQLMGKTVLLNEQITPDVIGGFIVKVRDLVIDNSIKNQLQRLHDQLISR